MSRTNVATLSFDSPLAAEQWRTVLIGGVSKQAHSKRYADVITNIANHQDAFEDEELTLLQPLGGNSWGILKICTVLSSIKNTIIMSVRGFPAEVANHELMSSANTSVRELLLDLQLEDAAGRARTKSKLTFLLGLIDIYDANAVTCGAGPKETARIIDCTRGLLEEIDRGHLAADDAIVEFRRELARMHKAAKRLANAG